VQRPIAAAAFHVVRLEVTGRKHWTISSVTRRRCVCWARGVNRKVTVKYVWCDVSHVYRENGFRPPHRGKSLQHFGCKSGRLYAKLGPQPEM
jgi:hypothetical protein